MNLGHVFSTGVLIIGLTGVSAFAASDQVTTPADRILAQERPVPSDRTGAGNSPADTDRVTACADQKGDVTGSPDCVPQNRPTAQGVSGCASRRDARGNVVYDDPSCPTRYRQSHREMGSSDQNVSLTKESAFFDRYVGKSVRHAREAEIAGDQGNSIELMQHANLALADAKQAQRAGNVPGLEEGIFELREAMTVGLSSNRARSHENRASSEAAADPTRCSSHTDGNGNVVYDDPACRTQYDQSGNTVQDATAHVREARIRLSEAAGMRPVDTRTPRAMGDSKSRVGAR